jgi:hypothetical protein
MGRLTLESPHDVIKRSALVTLSDYPQRTVDIAHARLRIARCCSTPGDSAAETVRSGQSEEV